MRGPPLFAFLNALMFALLCVTVHSYAVPDIRSKSAAISTVTTDLYNATVFGAVSPSASAALLPAHVHQKRGNWFSSPKSDTDSFVPQPEYTPRPGWFDRLKSGVSSAWNKIWIVEQESVGSESSWDTTGGEHGALTLLPPQPEPIGSEASWDTTGGENRAPDLRPPPNPPFSIPTAPALARDERTYEGFGASYGPSPRKETESRWWKWKSNGKAPASYQQTQDDPAPSELISPTPSELNHDASPNQRAPASPPAPYQRPDRIYGGLGVSYNPPKEPKSHWWQKSKGKAPAPDQWAQDARALEQRPHDASRNRYKSHKGPLRGVLKSLASEPKLNRQNLEALARDKDTEWEEEKKGWIPDWKEDNMSRIWWHHVRAKEEELGLKKEDRPPRDGISYYAPFEHASSLIAPHLVRTPVSVAAPPPVVSAAGSPPMLSTTPDGSGSGSSPEDGSGSFPGAGHVLGLIAPADDLQSIRSHDPEASSGAPSERGTEASSSGRVSFVKAEQRSSGSSSSEHVGRLPGTLYYTPDGGSSGSSPSETERAPSVIAPVPENPRVPPDFLQYPSSQGDGQPESSTQAARLEVARIAVEQGDTHSSEALDFDDQRSLHPLDSDNPEVPFVYQYQDGDMSVEETDMYLDLMRNARGIDHESTSSESSHSNPFKLNKGKGKVLPALPTIFETERWSPPESDEGSNSDRGSSQGRVFSQDEVYGTGAADLSRSLIFPGALESSGQSNDGLSALDGAGSVDSQDSSSFESNPGGDYTTPPTGLSEPQPPVLDDAKSDYSEDSFVSYDSYARSRTPPSPHISEVSELSSFTGDYYSSNSGSQSVHDEVHSAAVPENGGASDVGDTANEGFSEIDLAESGYAPLGTRREYMPRTESDPGHCKDPTWSDCEGSDSEGQRTSDSSLNYGAYPNLAHSYTGKGFDTEDATGDDEEENRRQALSVPRPGAPDPDQDRSRSSSPYEGILGRTRTGPPGVVHWADDVDEAREITPFNSPRPDFNDVSQHTTLPVASPGSPESVQEQGRADIPRQYADAADTPNPPGPPPPVPYHTSPQLTEDIDLGIGNFHRPGLPQYDNIFSRFSRAPSSAEGIAPASLVPWQPTDQRGGNSERTREERFNIPEESLGPTDQLDGSSERAPGLRSRPSRYFETGASSEPTVPGGIATGANADIRRPHPRLPGRTTINGYTEPISPQIKNVPERVGLDDHPPRPARIFREARISPIPRNSPERWAESARMRAIERDKWSDRGKEDRESRVLERPERSDQLAQWREDRERRTLAREERNKRNSWKRDLQAPAQEPVAKPMPVVQPELVLKPKPVVKPGTVMQPDPVLNPHRLVVSPTQPHSDQEIVKPTQLLPEFLNKKLPSFEMGKEEATRWAIGAILVVLAVILAFWVVSVVLRVVVSSVAGLGIRDHGNKPLLAW